VKVLVVEDEQRLAAVLAQALTEAGHDVDVCHTGTDGLPVALAGHHTVIVLDWMLPGMDGPTLCRTLRERGLTTPVMLLTARNQVQDRVEGLDALADDFLSKPFAIDEVLARVRALGRRSRPLDLPVLQLGDLHVDARKRNARRGDTPVTLTAREFDVLLLLAQNAGRCVDPAADPGRGLGRRDRLALERHRRARRDTAGKDRQAVRSREHPDPARGRLPALPERHLR